MKARGRNYPLLKYFSQISFLEENGLLLFQLIRHRLDGRLDLLLVPQVIMGQGSQVSVEFIHQGYAGGDIQAHDFLV